MKRWVAIVVGMAVLALAAPARADSTRMTATQKVVPVELIKFMLGRTKSRQIDIAYLRFVFAFSAFGGPEQEDGVTRPPISVGKEVLDLREVPKHWLFVMNNPTFGRSKQYVDSGECRSAHANIIAKMKGLTAKTEPAHTNSMAAANAFYACASLAFPTEIERVCLDPFVSAFSQIETNHLGPTAPVMRDIRSVGDSNNLLTARCQACGSDGDCAPKEVCGGNGVCSGGSNLLPVPPPLPPPAYADLNCVAVGSVASIYQSDCCPSSTGQNIKQVRSGSTFRCVVQNDDY